MTKDVQGTWVCEIEGDKHGVYYTYSVTVEGETKEAVDPYAKALGVNGNRGMIIDLDSTDPEGWDKDKHVTVPNNTDAVIYELHVRDTTIDESSGVENKGKYLGLTEKGTKTASGKATGLDYIKELGITHVQIMPMYDYATVDESKLDTPQFNWGYDPKNYNAPEGSYSTDPYNGEVRVEEAKEMIQAFHEEGIGVIMDVVYNHMYSAQDSCLDNTVPDYYFRMDGEKYTNGSGCGNEVASERSMARKFIVDSCVYWVTEYHVDGFRFDLMGCIDQETMLAIRAALDEIDPNIIILGEGWTGGTSGLVANEQTNKRVTYKVPGVAAFSDDIRDAIKGSVFDSYDNGFISGKDGQEIGIKYGVVAAVEHSGINYSAYEKTTGAWAGQPGQCITYSSCHDNLTLWDKIYYSAPDATEEAKLSMNKLSAAIIYTAQGVPFMLSGEEILRTKPIEGSDEFSHNSYNLNDYTNSIKWDTLDDANTADMLEYYKGLIAFRAAHPALRMTTTEDIEANLAFMEVEQKNVVAYTIANSPNGEKAKNILVAYNGNEEAVDITLPEGKWNVYINGEKAGTEVLETVEGTVSVPGISAVVLVQEGVNVGLIVGIIVAVLAIAAVAGVVVSKKKKAK
jgi:pullulanase